MPPALLATEIIAGGRSAAVVHHKVAAAGRELDQQLIAREEAACDLDGGAGEAGNG